jgi:acyl transferase domain-containing protein
MSSEPIAIVGVAAELPSGRHSETNLGHDEFFQFLLDGKTSYERIPKERFNADSYVFVIILHEDRLSNMVYSWVGAGLGQSITDHGSFLKNVGDFDPVEFGITGKDAKAMAVSARKLVELAFLALLDSGIDYRGKNIGCYASGISFDMQCISDPVSLHWFLYRRMLIAYNV